MGSQAAAELKGATYEQRCQWIENKKSIGNELFKKQEYAEAIDVYTASLCGLEFGKGISNDQKEYVELKLKVPILNNMALCLINQKHYDRALQMLDLVLKSDRKNEKALLRKCSAHIYLVDYDKA